MTDLRPRNSEDAAPEYVTIGQTQIQYAVRFTPGGIPVGVYEEVPVPRVEDQFLDCAVYLYHTAHAASKGEDAGGSGFLLRRRSDTHPDKWHCYAVTAGHVIEDGYPVVRLNTQEGGSDPIPLNETDWVRSHTTDLAIALIQPPSDCFLYKTVSTDFFLIPALITEHPYIGVGDDTFLVGRFVNHKGRQKNLPCVRCGNIAMLADPKEKVRVIREVKGKQKGKEYEAFLVELHTKCGFSGSPVFVHLHSPAVNQHRGRISRLDWSPEADYGPWLLGVHIGQLLDFTDKTVKIQETDTGMAIVIPAWHLKELLEEGRSVNQRRDADERFTKQKKAIEEAKWE
jgi:hypothetical protein